MEIQPQLDDLASSLDDLETSIQPIINAALSATTSKLPLLDKAKLYILATYALESILFSYLRLNGADAKSHPVYQELNRVKEYFAKIKTAEEVGAGGKSSGAGKLDKDAANRFIKAGLSGNDRYDRERRERLDKEKAGAKRKLENIGTGTHTRFDGAAKRIKNLEEETVGVVKADEADSDEGDVDVPQEKASESENVETKNAKKERHKGKIDRSKHKSGKGKT